MRIAVISDTHQEGNGWGSPPELLDALRGVDLILHCGDLEVLGILDHLETIAPVLAVRGYPDPHELRPAVGSSDDSRMSRLIEDGRHKSPLDGSRHLDKVGHGERLAERTRVVQAAGLHIGMVHDLEWPSPRVRVSVTGSLEFPQGSVQELMGIKFGGPVDLVCFGHTHEEYVGWHQGMLFINPGSTARPASTRSPGEIGTLAYLDISNGVASATILRLHRNA
ncbi:MAG: phosphodiesterase, family [Dehalococcoidia bacterium]|nr:phosphodiesterase, family [Dehalococcoidia bacterium]